MVENESKGEGFFRSLFKGKDSKGDKGSRREKAQDRALSKGEAESREMRDTFEFVSPEQERADREGRIEKLDDEIKQLSGMGGEASQEILHEKTLERDNLHWENAVDRINDGNILAFLPGDSVKVPNARKDEGWKVSVADDENDRYTLVDENSGGVKHVDRRTLVAWQDTAGKVAYERMSGSRRTFDRFRDQQQEGPRAEAESLARPAFEVASIDDAPQTADSELLRANIGLPHGRKEGSSDTIPAQQ